MPMESYLDKIDGLRDFVAEAWVSGSSNQQIADGAFAKFPDLEDVPHVNSIINWRKDEEVSNKVIRLSRERIARVVRLTDAKVVAALENEDLSVDEIIKIRKEFAPSSDILNKEEKTDRGAAAADLFQALEDDPELADRLAGDDGDR